MEARGIPNIGVADLQGLATDRSRTLYLLDVRSAEEFSQGSIEQAIHAPAVQLTQATDQWIGVRRARVVLVDDTGLRAAITGAFLRMLGYEVFVLAGIDSLGGEAIGRTEPVPAWTPPSLAPVAPEEAVRLAAQGKAILLDLRSSMQFRAGHLHSARWAIRPLLPAMNIDRSMPVFLAGPLEATAPAASDLATQGSKDIRQVTGVPERWKEKGLQLEVTPDRPSDQEAIDFLFFVHDRHDGNLEAARRYLAWETGLVALLDAAERSEYQIGRSPFAKG